MVYFPSRYLRFAWPASKYPSIDDLMYISINMANMHCPGILRHSCMTQIAQLNEQCKCVTVHGLVVHVIILNDLRVHKIVHITHKPAGRALN